MAAGKAQKGRRDKSDQLHCTLSPDISRGRAGGSVKHHHLDPEQLPVPQVCIHGVAPTPLPLCPGQLMGYLAWPSHSTRGP